MPPVFLTWISLISLRPKTTGYFSSTWNTSDRSHQQKRHKQYTRVLRMTTAGNLVSPVLNVKMLRFKEELSKGAPPGIEFACTARGWVT